MRITPSKCQSARVGHRPGCTSSYWMQSSNGCGELLRSKYSWLLELQARSPDCGAVSRRPRFWHRSFAKDRAPVPGVQVAARTLDNPVPETDRCPARYVTNLFRRQHARDLA